MYSESVPLKGQHSSSFPNYGVETGRSGARIQVSSYCFVFVFNIQRLQLLNVQRLDYLFINILDFLLLLFGASSIIFSHFVLSVQ